MKRRSFLLCAALLLASAGRGADLKLPDKVQGEPGTFIRVPATTDGKTVQWYALDPGLNLFPVDLLRDSKTAVVTGTVPGSYRLLAYTSDASGPTPPAVCTVTVGTPAPPTPPGPPTPTDPFSQAVQAAYTSCPDPAKATRIKDFAALYRQASTTTVNDPTLVDTSALLAVLIKARQALMPDTALPGVRKVVGTELNKTLAKPQALDATTRPLVGKLFAQVATALEGVK